LTKPTPRFVLWGLAVILVGEMAIAESVLNKHVPFSNSYLSYCRDMKGASSSEFPESRLVI